MSRSALVLVPLVAASCAAPPSPPPAPPRPLRPAPVAEALSPPAGSACPTRDEVPAFLARHGRSYGSDAQVDASLPRTIAGKVSAGGEEGDFELVLDRAGHRRASLVAGVFAASGVDSEGAWELGLGGASLRLRDIEAVEVAFESWFWRRSYVSSFDPARDEVLCEDVAGARRVSVRYRLRDLGNPELVFDPATAALLYEMHSSTDGQKTGYALDAWSPPDPRGVRWPTEFRAPGITTLLETSRVSTNEAGLRCAAHGPAWPAAGDCLAPFAPSVAATWPGAAPVRVPLSYDRDALAIHVRAKGPEAWARVDSASQVTVVDTSNSAVSGFHPGVAAGVSAAAERITDQRFGLLDSLSVGGLTLAHLPALGMSGEVLAAFDRDGDRRPAAVVGFALFLAAAVRVDYAKRELVLGRTADTLHGPGAIPLEVRVLHDRVVAHASIAGSDALVQLDTGAAAGFVLSREWSATHGLPGDRPLVEQRAQVGVGTQLTSLTLVRIDRARLGPVAFDGKVIAVVESPAMGGFIAGVAGEPLFSRCAAMTWDLPERKVWFEPPCDGAPPEQLAGWGLKKSEEAGHPDRPWVLRFVFDRSAAANAGLKAGDRLLEVAGMPATGAARFERATRRAAGTKVPVTVDRDGQRIHAVLELVPFP